MNLLTVAFLAAVALLLGYLLYGALLSRLFRLSGSAKMPAQSMRDDVDYIPTPPKYLLGQHFSAIAAAGPIVGPILAGLMFGWVPAIIWIVVGSIFIGGVHDFGALVASVRHKARSIAEIVREYMSHRSYLLFLAFVWLTIVYVVVAFTDIVANSFVGSQTLENNVTVTGGGIATSSMLYLALPIVMALLMRYAKLGLAAATAIFLPLVGVAIWAGQYIPLDLARILNLTDAQAVKVWDVLLLSYCVIASIVPVWMLLQPRGHLGGYFLYTAIAIGVLGIVFGGKTVEYPAFKGWTSAAGDSLFPMLLITVACGACSGFHALVASGTSSKQLRSELDAKPIAYGAMLLEGLVAVVSLCCLMMLKSDATPLKGAPSPNLIYGFGMCNFLGLVGVPAAFGISFALLAFTTFVYDTLDVSTRLGRYIFQELTGWQGRLGRWVATVITAGVPLFFVTQKTVDAKGNAIPAWKAFWSVFGASNQLLAALTLMALTVWLMRTRRSWWVWLVTGVPAAIMFTTSGWALLGFVRKGFYDAAGNFKAALPSASTLVSLVLLILALVLFVETVIALSKRNAPSPQAN